MYMVREVINCKPGKVSVLANKFTAVGEIMRTMDLEPHRLYTDLSGEPFWTLVVEREYETLDQAHALEAQVFGDERSRGVSVQFLVQNFVKGQAVILFGRGILDRISRINPVNLGGFQHQVGINLDSTQPGGGVGREKRVTGTGREDNYITAFQV